MISQVSRLRRSGIRAVAQNTQPMAQPTCDERQTLTAPGLCNGIKHRLDGQTIMRAEEQLLKAVDRRGDRSLADAAAAAGVAIASRSRRGDLKVARPDRRVAECRVRPRPRSDRRIDSLGDIERAGLAGEDLRGQVSRVEHGAIALEEYGGRG